MEEHNQQSVPTDKPTESVANLDHTNNGTVTQSNQAVNVENSNQASTNVPQSSQLSEQPKKKHKALRIVIGVVIVLVLFVLFLVFTFIKANSDINAAKSVGNTFLQDMVGGNGQAAYQLTGSQLRQVTSENTLEAISTALHHNVTGTPTSQNNWNITKSTGNPETATVNYTVSADGSSGTINMTLQKINGNWQVNYVFFPSSAVKGYTVQ